jgi:RNA polymerase sigma-70 factor (ECF subfamily)
LDGQADQELLSLLADNLDDNFHLLVMAYKSRLHRFVLTYLRNAQEAQDVVQDVMVNAYFALKRYGHEKIRELKLDAWLYTIARNEFRHRMVAAKKRQSVSLVELPEDFEDTERESLESLVEKKESLDMLWEGIEHLPLRYREILVLHYFSDLTYPEIAEILNIPLNTAKSNGLRGLKLLRIRLAEVGRSGTGQP